MIHHTIDLFLDASFSLMTFYYLFIAQLLYVVIYNRISLKFLSLAYIASLLINLNYAPLLVDTSDSEFQKQLFLAHLFWQELFSALDFMLGYDFLWRLKVANPDTFPVAIAFILSLIAIVKYVFRKNIILIPFIVLGVASSGALFVSHFLMMTGVSYTYLLTQQEKDKFLPELEELESDKMFLLSGYKILGVEEGDYGSVGDNLGARVRNRNVWAHEANIVVGGVYVAFNDADRRKLYIKKDEEFYLNFRVTEIFNRQLSIAFFYWFVVVIVAMFFHRKKFPVFKD